jgi:hypothetical protein
VSGKATVGGWSKLTLDSAAAGGSRSLWMLGFLLSASAHALPLAAIWLTSEGPSVSTGTAFAVDLVIVEAGDPSSGEADVPTSPQAAQVLEDRPAPSAEAAAEDASELPPPQPAAGEEETGQEAAAVEPEVSSATPAPQAKLLQPRREKAALSGTARSACRAGEGGFTDVGTARGSAANRKWDGHAGQPGRPAARRQSAARLSDSGTPARYRRPCSAERRGLPKRPCRFDPHSRFEWISLARRGGAAGRRTVAL